MDCLGLCCKSQTSSARNKGAAHSKSSPCGALHLILIASVSTSPTPRVMGSTLSERCLALDGRQIDRALTWQLRSRTPNIYHQRFEQRSSYIRRNSQHLTQPSLFYPRKVVCGYQRTAIAPPRGGTFPLPIDYTQVSFTHDFLPADCHCQLCREPLPGTFCSAALSSSCTYVGRALASGVHYAPSNIAPIRPPAYMKSCKGCHVRQVPS